MSDGVIITIVICVTIAIIALFGGKGKNDK